MPSLRYIILAIALVLYSCFTTRAESRDGNMVYEVTASKLNVRQGPTTGSAVIGVLTKGTIVAGERTSGVWIRINRNGQRGYIHSDYVRVVRSVPLTAPKARKSFWKRFEPGPFGTLLLVLFGIPFLLSLFQGLLNGIIELIKGGLFLIVDMIRTFGILYIAFFIAFLPFRILNRLQIILHKPWRFLQKHSWPADGVKPFLRIINVIAMAPLYIILTPLRFINAVAFNVILRPLSEMWNYICEVFAPSAPEEGGDSFWKWIVFLPVRILKYPVGHGLLTLTECLIFTIVDTIYPAVTLYHGTSGDAADAIIISPRRTRHHKAICGRMDGIWNVGGGNYAGDGIYFAPRSSTSLHYARTCSRPVLIICRVSLGRLLPLSLAPDEVFCAAGHPNAHKVTQYGLDNGYDSIEWWRSDASWWEYCLLDWQNRYNESWRIRPVMVMNINSYFFKRINGGARHWLFDKDIYNDIRQSTGI